MNIDDKIKVLILDDEDTGLAFAKAGLIPQFGKLGNDVDHLYRTELAEKSFCIEMCESISGAIEKLKSFIPDLVIIDIDIKDKEVVNINGTTLINGIDFYRYLENDKTFEGSKILFSASFGVAKYYNELSIKEKENFIPKATSGVGFEILASKISSYLFEVAKSITKSVLPQIKQRIESDISTLSFNDIKEYPYQFSKRKIKPKYLLMFCSYPSLITVGKKTTVSLEFNEAQIAFNTLIQIESTEWSSNNFRAEWRQNHMQNAILYYHANLVNKEDANVNNKAKAIVVNIFKNIDKKTEQRLHDYSVAQFGFSSFKSATIGEGKNSSKTFLKNFLTALTIRRALIFIELFNRDYYDRQNSNLWKQYVGSYLHNFVNETFQSLKKKGTAFSPAQLTQFGDMLNFSFKEPVESDKRASIDLNATAFLDCEKDWFKTKEYEEWKTHLYNQLKR